MGIVIVTDSTSDIPKRLVEKHGIIELPLVVRFGDEEFRDRVDMMPKEFFERLRNSEELPTTSQIAPLMFKGVYEKELEKGNSVISIHLSGEFSGTYQSAVTAKQMIGDDRISVIDSRNATFAFGMIVLKAVELIESGMGQKEIVDYIEDYKKRIKIGIVVDTLEYLRKGGRLSSAQAIVGSLLNIKPILTIDDGKVIVIDKVRGEKKALKRIIEFMKEQGNDIQSQIIGIANADCAVRAEELKDLIIEEFGDVKFIDSDVGCVIGTHIGPGAVGAVFI